MNRVVLVPFVASLGLGSPDVHDIVAAAVFGAVLDHSSSDQLCMTLTVIGCREE